MHHYFFLASLTASAQKKHLETSPSSKRGAGKLGCSLPFIIHNENFAYVFLLEILYGFYCAVVLFVLKVSHRVDDDGAGDSGNVTIFNNRLFKIIAARTEIWIHKFTNVSRHLYV